MRFRWRTLTVSFVVLLVVWLVVLFVSGLSVSAGRAWARTARAGTLVEAEGFDDPGGWVVDQQFMDQMGSPMLLAHGMGQPV